MNQTYKRITSVFLTCAMFLTLLPAGALAAEGETEETTPALEITEDIIPDSEAGADQEISGTAWFAGGDGSQEDPYRISTLEQLKAFRDSVNGGESYQNKYIRLTADLDLGYEEWEPIGGAGTGNRFAGIFDGDGHTISNLKITRGLENTAANNNVGLFGACASPATLQNMTLENVDVQGSLCVGAVLGDSQTSSSTISNVHVTGSVRVRGWWYVGGILGKGYGTVTGCSVEGDGTDTSYVQITGGYAGGIVGFMGEGNCVTADCSVKHLTVEGLYNGIGGINGILHYGNTIRDCTAEDVVVWQTTDPDAEEDRIYCGAFAGTYLASGGAPTLRNCTFTGGLYCGPEKTDILEPTRYVGSLWYGAEPPADVNIENCTIHMRPVAQVGGQTYSTLSEAIAAAQSGDTVKLLSDVTIQEAVSFDGSSYALAIETSLTIDGSSEGGENHTIAMSTPRGIAVKGGDSNVAVTFRNLNLEQTSGRSCIETRGGVGSLILDGAVLSAENSQGNAQVLTIGGNQSEPARVSITNSAITSNRAGYGVVVFNPIDLEIRNSVLTGWGALYFKGPSSSAGSRGSNVTVTGNSVLNSRNENGAGDNQFGAIVFEDDNVSVTIENAAIHVSSAAPNEQQAAVSFGWYYGAEPEEDRPVAGNQVYFRSGAEVTLAGDRAVFTGETGENGITITGGTYSFDPSAYVPEGYVVSGSGPYTVSEKTAGGSGGNSGSTSGGSSSTGDKTETVTHPDGSTTTTVTRPNGTVTETTNRTDGSTQVVHTQPDGTVTTTSTDTDGNKTETVAKPDGSSVTKVEQADGSASTTTVTQTGRVESEVQLSQSAVDASENGTVTLPIPAVSAGEERSEAPTVTVTLPADTTARVEVPVESVTPGTVAILVKPDGTEEVLKASLTTENGVAVTLSGGETIKIVDNSKSFDDVEEAHWGADAIDYASSRELLAGTGANTFSPEGEMTRAMVVTVLARYEGVDTSTGENWYDAGLQWAVENGVSDGTSLHDAVSREQLAAMLWRYAGSLTPAGGTEAFVDSGCVSPWATQAMAWAVENGIIRGVGNDTLDPQGSASRAQVARILMNFAQLGLN